MKKIFTLVLVTFICWVSAAQNALATVIHIEACHNNSSYSCITGIDAIDVLGNSYDMIVLEGSFDDLFADPTQDISYWADDSWAIEAVRSIKSILNDLDPVPSSGDTRWASYTRGGHLLLPYQFTTIIGIGPPRRLFDNACIDINATINTGHCVAWDPTSVRMFAEFEPATISSPNTTLLIIAALLCMLLQKEWNRPSREKL